MINTPLPNHTVPAVPPDRLLFILKILDRFGVPSRAVARTRLHNGAVLLNHEFQPLGIPYDSVRSENALAWGPANVFGFAIPRLQPPACWTLTLICRANAGDGVPSASSWWSR